MFCPLSSGQQPQLGCCRLLVTISQDSVQLAATASAGLLAGAALAVIVPEGFESFSSAQAAGECCHTPDVQSSV